MNLHNQWFALTVLVLACIYGVVALIVHFVRPWIN